MATFSRTTQYWSQPKKLSSDRFVCYWVYRYACDLADETLYSFVLGCLNVTVFPLDFVVSSICHVNTEIKRMNEDDGTEEAQAAGWLCKGIAVP